MHSTSRATLFAALAAATLASAPAFGAFFTVSNLADSGAGSLRAAITSANGNANDPTVDVIDFDVAGTITLATALPTITHPLFIDATTAPGYSSAPVVRLDGAALASGDGLNFTAAAASSGVAGLAITGFPGDGIDLSGDSSGVTASYIGLALDGTSAAGNDGVGIRVAGAGVTIGGGTSARNVISGNGSHGIQLVSTAGFSAVRGNRIGTNAAGTAAVPNGGDGVSVEASGATVGGSAAGNGNLISGNSGWGIQFSSATSFSAAQGNVIGLDAAGTAALANASGGIRTSGDDTLIGSTTADGRNVIAGNTSVGIMLFTGSNGADVYGNYIGTNLAGTAAVAGQMYGIRVTGTVTNCTIGGTNSTYRNVISGASHWGISLESDVSGCVVSGNYIGTNAAGTAAIPNATGVDLGGSNNTVGGDSAGERNLISGNSGYGVYLRGATNKVQGNYIGTNAVGDAAIANNNGIRVDGAIGCSIGGTNAGEGNLISGNTGDAVEFLGNTSGVSVLGNLVGTNAAATAAIANGDGVDVDGDAHFIGGATAAARNLISGNTGAGVTLRGTNQVVYGNYVGTNAAGTAALANGGWGINAYDGSGHQIGGTAAGQGNLISGNSYGGINVAGTGNIVRGNKIGTNLAGDAAVANGGGMSLWGSGHTIGGPTAASRNLISGNSGGGISIHGDNHSVVGNYIGTNAAGTVAIANGGNGIRVLDAAAGSIGSNLISGNSSNGIAFDGESAGFFVQGNKIGTNAAGTAAIANGTGIGVGGTGHEIGGDTADARNLLSGNSSYGLFLSGSDHVVRGNYVGVDVTGAAALGNGSYGIRSDTLIDSTIGGLTVAEGNVIAGNGRGVNFGYGSHGNVVLNNVIGLNAAATTDLADNGTGIEIGDSFDNTIGLPDAGNVIAGMSYHGIGISGAGSYGNVIQGNWIGTNKALATTLGNDFAGIFITDSSGNTIGGTGAGEGNVLAHNYQFGVWVERGEGNEISGNSVYGNYFGIDIDAQGFFPNDGGDGDDGGNRRQNYPLISSAVVNGGSTDVEGLLINEPNTEYRVEFFSSPDCGNAGFGQGRTFRGSTQVTTNGGGQAALATSIPLPIADDFLTATVTDPLGNTSEFSPCAQVDLGENPGRFQFDREAYVGYEGILPTAKVIVTRSHGLSGTATVNFTTSNGSATAGADYTDSDQTLTFAPWEVVKHVEVPILLEVAPEPDHEKVLLALTSPSAGALLGTPATSEIQIIDFTDDWPGLTVGDAFVDEGNSDQKMLTFEVKLTATDHEVKVTYLTEPGSAVEGEDYIDDTDVITFPPSASTQTQNVQIPILGDTDVEADEIVWLRITSAAGSGNWIAYDTYGRGEIRNDDFSTPPPGNTIFADSFEIGSSALWSNTVPTP